MEEGARINKGIKSILISLIDGVVLDEEKDEDGYDHQEILMEILEYHMVFKL